MTPKSWFEISNEGWRRLNAGRPLAALLREGIQNAFDAGATEVDVRVEPSTIVIEDDGTRGFSDQRLVYTLFLTDKADSPTQRGRKGRGLKEMLAAADCAVVETVGTTVTFDRQGRHEQSNQRTRGTRITLQRRTSAQEIEKAQRLLSLIIPPEDTTLRINRRHVRPPSHVLTIPECVLETVVLRQGLERLMERPTNVDLYGPRPNEEPHVFEMGIPVQPVNVPWHVDVGQRIPLADGRDKVDEFYRLTLLATLFEALIYDHLSLQELQGDWISEVLSRCELSPQALTQYAQLRFGSGAVLSSSRRADDRARQAGAKVIDVRGLGRGAVEALARVMETSEEMVNRKLEAAREDVPTQGEELARFAALWEELGRRLLGRSVRVVFMRKPANLAGLVDDGLFDRRRWELAVNLDGSVRVEDPLHPQSLAVLFHELAHGRCEEHDARFIRELERLAGIGARLLADEGDALRERFGLDRKRP